MIEKKKTREEQKRMEMWGAIRSLRDAAHLHADKYEPTQEFPGVDIDAVHRQSS